jgi:hypothetical protein
VVLVAVEKVVVVPEVEVVLPETGCQEPPLHALCQIAAILAA